MARFKQLKAAFVLKPCGFPQAHETRAVKKIMGVPLLGSDFGCNRNIVSTQHQHKPETVLNLPAGRLGRLGRGAGL